MSVDSSMTAPLTDMNVWTKRGIDHARFSDDVGHRDANDQCVHATQPAKFAHEELVFVPNATRLGWREMQTPAVGSEPRAHFNMRILGQAFAGKMSRAGLGTARSFERNILCKLTFLGACGFAVGRQKNGVTATV